MAHRRFMSQRIMPHHASTRGAQRGPHCDLAGPQHRDPQSSFDGIVSKYQAIGRWPISCTTAD